MKLVEEYDLIYGDSSRWYVALVPLGLCFLAVVLIAFCKSNPLQEPTIWVMSLGVAVFSCLPFFALRAEKRDRADFVDGDRAIVMLSRVFSDGPLVSADDVETAARLRRENRLR